MQEVSIKTSILFLIILLASNINAQSKNSGPIDSMLIKPRLKIDLNKDMNQYKTTLSLKRLKNKTYAELLPFFCKMEHKMSRNARIPVRIRLGSLDYVNKLEGKRN